MTCQIKTSCIKKNKRKTTNNNFNFKLTQQFAQVYRINLSKTQCFHILHYSSEFLVLMCRKRANSFDVARYWTLE